MARVLVGPHTDDVLSRPSEAMVQKVFRVLADLDAPWTIAIRPTVANLDPDVLALHPHFGVCAIVVKDWAPGSHRLTFNGILERKDGQEWRPAVESPSGIAREHRETICRQYFGGYDSAVVRGLVVLPHLTTGEACNLLRPRMVDDENWIEVWGGHEFARTPEWALTGDPRGRIKRVPQPPFEQLLRQLTLETHLQPA